jgi:hypothetical protein
MKNHLRRKVLCLPRIRLIPPENLYERVLGSGKTPFHCTACNKYYKSNVTLGRHICKPTLLVENLVKDTKEEATTFTLESPNVKYITENVDHKLDINDWKTIPAVVKSIYFNEKHPENQCVYIKNFRKSVVSYFSNCTNALCEDLVVKVIDKTIAIAVSTIVANSVFHNKDKQVDSDVYTVKLNDILSDWKVIIRKKIKKDLVAFTKTYLSLNSNTGCIREE